MARQPSSRMRKVNELVREVIRREQPDRVCVERKRLDGPLVGGLDHGVFPDAPPITARDASGPGGVGGAETGGVGGTPTGGVGGDGVDAAGELSQRRPQPALVIGAAASPLVRVGGGRPDLVGADQAGDLARRHRIRNAGPGLVLGPGNRPQRAEPRHDQEQPTTRLAAGFGSRRPLSLEMQRRSW